MIFSAPKKENIPELYLLWQEAFGDTKEFIDSFFENAFTPSNCRCAFKDGKLVSALYWFDCVHENEPVAYLYAIATFKAHQGKGICSALIKDTHAHLKSLGFKGACLVPSSEGLFGFYKKLNYKTFSYVTEHTVFSSENPHPVKKITKEEYAEVREKLLPQSSVLQENKNLDFLEAHSEFFSAENLVFTQKS